MRYPVRLALSGLRLRHKRAHGLLVRDFVSWLRVEFLGAAAGTGLLAALATPRTAGELADELDVADAGLLVALLEVGRATGELDCRRGRWRLAGVRSRALVDPAVDGLAALPEEAVSYGADVYRRLGDRLAGAPRGDYLATCGEVVARTSRVAEPIFGPLLADLVRTREARSVLEVGCGSGVNLRHVAEASPHVTGTGLDVDPGVVALARRELAAWGLAGRISVREADVRALPDDLARPWDLVLLMQNIYYFGEGERTDLLSRLHRLVPHGALVVATAVRGTGDPAAAHLDLVLRSTAGNTPLPTVDELRSDLRVAGFRAVEVRRLAPFQPLRALVAW
ncbi:MAG TPA: methyltransferase domain-containing protein [Acidimicrobiales bacterium]|nr:methyltransferase domain-containing protein [Acidimicrobiales bacterium]